ncbi:MAG: hypothetical protein COA66_10155 [Arcobacter sp.]|nr:MAG: hypothetical protein COA66_10155 [Arcobacter sp.]
MKRFAFVFLVLFSIASKTLVWAHDPIFGIGPHVLFKGGVEVELETHLDKAGKEQELEQALGLKYGLTGDWAIGLEVPYVLKEDDNKKSQGLSDISFFTKYRFYRKDILGVQESAAVLLKVISNSADDNDDPSLGTGTTDGIVGLTYGYESLTWYRWASIRYRQNGRNDAGLQRGEKILFDISGGYRPVLNNYTEADTVWILELNAEFGESANLNGSEVANTGGDQLFLSPGIFWTKRNFAIKAGVQIPIISNLNGTQDDTDYRAKFVLEWHF